MRQLLDLANETLLQIIDDVIYIDLESLTLSCKRLYVLEKKRGRNITKRKTNTLRSYTAHRKGVVPDGTRLHPNDCRKVVSRIATVSHDQIDKGVSPDKLPLGKLAKVEL